jgi:hypothetical protein
MTGEYEVDLKKPFRGKVTLREIFGSVGVGTNPAAPPSHWTHMVVALDETQREALAKTGFVEIEPAVEHYPRPGLANNQTPSI